MNGIKAPIYQSSQIRSLEEIASERFGVTSAKMMQRAGKASIDFLLKRWPQTQHVLVLCGCGNNGGDGYRAAEVAHQRGLKVTILQVGDVAKLTPMAKEAYHSCIELHIPTEQASEETDMTRFDVIIDAICGIGLKTELRQNVVTVLKKLEKLMTPVLALDVPTGVDADTGDVLGAAIRASATITFVGVKLGLVTGKGMAYTGELVVNDLQLPSDLFSFIEPIAEKILLSSYIRFLKPRTRDWHKGLSGHVLVLGGDYGYSGAVRMAAEAALRIGAGLVSVATREDHALILNANRPEIMCHAINKPKELESLLEKADVLVIGPGLGQSDWGKALCNTVSKIDLPKVLDADALNLLAQEERERDDWILTPHPGEAARLLHSSIEEVQKDRLTAAQEINDRYGGVCVLKGSGTIVVAKNTLPGLCDKGNPGMASAGMGDILSGVIGGLLAQGIPLGDAAKLGVYLHAVAGDLAAKEGERGMIATDLLPYLRRLANPTLAL